MTPDAAPSPHSLATASGLLLGALAAAMLVGALVRWALGSAGSGFSSARSWESRSACSSCTRSTGGPRGERRRIFSTPRPLPSRIGRGAGGTIIALALPIFAIAGWPLQGWALAAVLWVASEIFALVLARLPTSAR
jgi:hypothetical protein